MSTLPPRRRRPAAPGAAPGAAGSVGRVPPEGEEGGAGGDNATPRSSAGPLAALAALRSAPFGCTPAALLAAVFGGAAAGGGAVGGGEGDAGGSALGGCGDADARAILATFSSFLRQTGVRPAAARALGEMGFAAVGSKGNPPTDAADDDTASTSDGGGRPGLAEPVFFPKYGCVLLASVQLGAAEAEGALLHLAAPDEWALQARARVDGLVGRLR